MKTIVIDDLREGMLSNQTICDIRGTILVAKGVTLTNSIIKRLRKFNIALVDINDEGEEIPTCSADTAIAQETTVVVNELINHVVELRTLTIKDNMTAIETVIHSVMKRPFIQEFLSASITNKILYEHSLRTAILTTNLGLVQGYDSLNLEYLAMSAIVHDCGMEGEFTEDHEHPLTGFMKLRENLDVDMVIALVCLQHHEHYNGSGFPFAFRRNQFTEFSSLVAVVDHYDRLFMKNHNPRKALFETIGQKNLFFDPKMIDLFSSTIDWSQLYT